MLKLEKLTSWNFTEWNFPPLYPLTCFKVKGESWSRKLIIFLNLKKIKCAKLQFKIARYPAKRYSLCRTRLRRIARAIKGKLELAALLCRYGDSIIKQRDWSVHPYEKGIAFFLSLTVSLPCNSVDFPYISFCKLSFLNNSNLVFFPAFVCEGSPRLRQSIPQQKIAAFWLTVAVSLFSFFV